MHIYSQILLNQFTDNDKQQNSKTQNTNQWMNNVMNETIPSVNDISDFNAIEIMYLPPISGRFND